MRSHLLKAKKAGAELIVYPEVAYFIAHSAECIAITARYSEILERFCAWAKEFDMDLIPGSLRQPAADPDKNQNCLPYIDRGGKVIASYQKIFLFRAELPDRPYDETRYCNPGNEIVVVDRPFGKVGLSICFDLRFPELYRSLKKRGAQIIVAPSSYTVPTGKVHWETLLKARAIENQCFVVAPGLIGKCGDGRDTYGHSSVVSPWGEILENRKKKRGVSIVELDLGSIDSLKKRLDPWMCRREDLFPIP